MSDFKWKVLILDDVNPLGNKNYDTAQILNGYGLDAHVLGFPLSGVSEHFELLFGVDFAYCDLHWEIPSVGEEAFLPQNAPNEDRHRYIEQWVEAVSYWTDQPNPPKASTESVWPKGRIEYADAGLWIAAMLKNASPNAQIILYSSHPEIARSGPLAPIGLFSGSPFHVETKLSSEPLPLYPLEDLLKSAQKDRLKRPDLRRWFLADVLMRRLAGQQPKERELQSLHGTEKLTFKAELFFPNFKDASRFELKDVRDLLEFGSDLSVWQRSGLEDLKHRMERVLESGTSVENDKIHSLISYCYDCGEAGEPIGVALQTKDKSENTKRVREALSFCRSALASRESDLLSLCEEHDGTLAYNESASLYEPGSELSEDRTNPILPFQYYYLRRSVNALAANALDHKQTGGLSTRLEAVVGDHVLTVTWLDNSVGFPSLKDFEAALVESMDTSGAYRGIPLGILFGLRYNAVRIEVLIRGDSNWHSLWPCEEILVTKSSTPDMSFGLRWTFDHRQP